MRSEFQFLQSENDENEFAEAFAMYCDALEKESDSQCFFRIGDCRIQFLRSRRKNDTIAVGRIALATHGFGLSFISAPQAEALFRKMRTWLKKRYHNKLTAENITIPESTTSYRNMWLGPGAQQLYRNSNITLKSITNGPVIIKEEPE
jgi:hypothetical protein